MIVDNPTINIKSFKYTGLDIEKIINNFYYPIKNDYFTFGIYDKYDTGTRDLYNILVSYSSTSKVPTFKNNKLIFEEKQIEKYSYGQFSLNKSKSILEIINSEKVATSVIKNEFGIKNSDKYTIDIKKYNSLYNNSFIRTAGSYLVQSPIKDYKVNIKSEELAHDELKELFMNCTLKNTSFNGRIIVDRELSVKIGSNGSILLYNSHKNPLKWQDVFKFMDEYIY